ncbi:hypothetical protein FACS1894166_03510 [Bacilli bacterium]|nr:hypothetical protein FACS1894166_03510 [Bacilli bacterium]
MISHKGKLIFKFNTKLLWIRTMEEYDYATINFVLDEFADDQLYCFTVLDQYFEHRAMDINLKDLLSQLN